MIRQWFIKVVIAAMAVLMTATAALGAIPRLISYQGIATDSLGNPVPDGAYFARFYLYDTPTGGNAVWFEMDFEHPSITTKDGLFTYLLGSINPIPDSVFVKYDSLYLQVMFNFQNLTSRTPIVSTGYAFRVNTVDGASGGTIYGNQVKLKSIYPGVGLELDESGDTDWSVTNFQGDFYIGSGGASRLIITSDGTTKLVPASGNVAIGEGSPSTRLHVSAQGADVATFNRNTNDGTIIRISQAGVTEGTISVAGTTVSYNAFTGSHYGWTDETLERGELVTLTGANRSSHDNPESEIVYGIKRSTAPNDPACFGSYLALQSPTLPYSSENPYLIMAVGNGDMWVVDEGQNIQPGDYLISSSTPGHAMKDDEVKYQIGHVVARAAEAVDWGSVSESTDGCKHKRISVLFGNFVRSGDATVRRLIESQQQQIDFLEKKLEEIQGQLPQAKP